MFIDKKNHPILKLFCIMLIAFKLDKLKHQFKEVEILLLPVYK